MGIVVADEVHLTLGYRVAAAWDMANNYTSWGAYGRITPWADEDNPPDEDSTASVIEEVQGFRLIVPANRGCVYPSNADDYDFTYQGVYWKKATSLADALENGARWALFKLTLLVEDGLPVVTFRQVGLFLNLVPAPGYEAYAALLPDQVDSVGTFYFYANHMKWVRTAQSSDVITFVIEY